MKMRIVPYAVDIKVQREDIKRAAMVKNCPHRQQRLTRFQHLSIFLSVEKEIAIRNDLVMVNKELRQIY
ncbi:unnamed protein product [Gongylonema pulchrum]|uniref:Uncharacterized protein n=1 Tax=Gongylonema pulchrum TaxID=637853 RepID=A0A183DWS5_9BILA|nr:unnamed protein product [Gongylonema pulchrum]